MARIPLQCCLLLVVVMSTSAVRAPAHAQPAAADPSAQQPSLAEGAGSAASDVDANALRIGEELVAAQHEMALRFYGFADFSAAAIFNRQLSPFFGESPEFTVGNFNLYMAADFTERWRSLSEVRFTFLPDGSLDSSLRRVSNTVFDNANIGAQFSWGGISIQRIWIEYSPHELVTIRAGHWLTPVGIWNVEHGTPTIITTFRPFAISAGFFPERQTGIEIYGSHLFGRVTLGYHLTISNGRNSAYMDLDRNKALGGRLYATLPFLGTLTLGGSVYAGRYTESDGKLDGTMLTSDIKLQYDELAYAADVLWQWQGLHVQSEVFSQQIAYVGSKRPLPTVPTANGGRVPDHHLWGGYALFGYRFSGFPIMPFIQLGYSNLGGHELLQVSGRRVTVTYAGGLNYPPIPQVTLKAEFYRLYYIDTAGTNDDSASLIIASIAWSF